MYIPQDNVEAPLYVVSVIFNPQRYKVRWKHYYDFQKRIRESGAILLTVEASFGERTPALECHAPAVHEPLDLSRHVSHGPTPIRQGASMPQSRMFQDYIKVRVRHQQEIWLKENLQNIAAQHLPEDARYVAFIDADTAFTRSDWVSETLHALQHYHVVQMFSSVTELSPTFNPHQMHRGYMFSHCNGVKTKHGGGHCGYYPGADGHRIVSTDWHPGYAWAWRREALEAVGGLLDFAILGAADRHMACALIGRVKDSFDAVERMNSIGLHKKYKEWCLRWERRAVEHLKMNVGYIEGNLLHYWHGRKINRQYFDRWRILVKHQFNPETDLKRDMRGIFALTDKKPHLRDDIRRYFRARHEDSIDMPDEDDRLLGPLPVMPR